MRLRSKSKWCKHKFARQPGYQEFPKRRRTNVRIEMHNFPPLRRPEKSSYSPKLISSSAAAVAVKNRLRNGTSLHESIIFFSITQNLEKCPPPLELKCLCLSIVGGGGGGRGQREPPAAGWTQAENGGGERSLSSPKSCWSWHREWFMESDFKAGAW
jgi:hypothetical protein